MGDLVGLGTRLQVKVGGRGGRGNRQFVSAINQEPLLSEVGEVGEEVRLFLELKLLADVGVVGVPNAGKSSLLVRVSAAKPRVAPYPFTTTEPVLAVVETRGQDFVMAEIPGLLEGAHRGVGLGHQFLRHAERTRVLLHLLDGTASDIQGDWQKVNAELTAYSPEFAGRPQVVAVNKIDLPEVRERIPDIRQALEGVQGEVSFISAATGEGVEALLGQVLLTLERVPRPQDGAKSKPEVIVPVQPAGPQREVTRAADGRYMVRWSQAERLAARADLDDWRVEAQLRRELLRLGVSRALEVKGVRPGDIVCIGGRELEWR